MKTNLKYIFIVAGILFVSVALNKCHAQQIHALAGYKSLEIGYTYTDEETELIYGVSVSGVDANTAERRANINDKGVIHEFNGSVIFTGYGLVGAKFDRLNIVGKIGIAYVSQKINNEPTKDLFLALGLMASYSISERYSLCASYDSVNSVQAGISITL